MDPFELLTQYLAHRDATSQAQEVAPPAPEPLAPEPPAPEPLASEGHEPDHVSQRKSA